jgi:hypothetical protein
VDALGLELFELRLLTLVIDDERYAASRYMRLSHLRALLGKLAETNKTIELFL